ncbi:unnamed protein product [Amoebophrya sp. A25]|nr:unnamed protein product [Amoebophrya sp. A25]|eukprot:GSA25T00001946001.1
MIVKGIDITINQSRFPHYGNILRVYEWYLKNKVQRPLRGDDNSDLNTDNDEKWRAIFDLNKETSPLLLCDFSTC